MLLELHHPIDVSQHLHQLQIILSPTQLSRQQTIPLSQQTIRLSPPIQHELRPLMRPRQPLTITQTHQHLTLTVRRIRHIRHRPTQMISHIGNVTPLRLHILVRRQHTDLLELHHPIDVSQHLHQLQIILSPTQLSRQQTIPLSQQTI
ncbi:hypothetical protein, partial [Actinoplanes sp. NPDC049265]|uniref:hypothetical protein n=1 Tax=Actinoplanes sp. NPDC049265 TaxID=3363902 RepID=UPI00371111D0